MATKIAALQKSLMVMGKPKLQTFMKYAKVELVPPNPAELPQAFRELGGILRAVRTGAWKRATIKQATINTVVTLEVLCWFFVGECIGKFHLIGYNV